MMRKEAQSTAYGVGKGIRNFGENVANAYNDFKAGISGKPAPSRGVGAMPPAVTPPPEPAGVPDDFKRKLVDPRMLQRMGRSALESIVPPLTTYRPGIQQGLSRPAVNTAAPKQRGNWFTDMMTNKQNWKTGLGIANDALGLFVPTVSRSWK